MSTKVRSTRGKIVAVAAAGGVAVSLAGLAVGGVGLALAIVASPVATVAGSAATAMGMAPSSAPTAATTPATAPTDATTPPTAPTAAPPAPVTKVQARPMHHLRTEASSNWAGPVLTGSNYGSVTTAFVVPQASCSSSKFMIASFWAGLDGATSSSNTVEQAGVDVDCDKGNDSYQAWTEEYPAPSEPIDSDQFSIEPGDSVRISVTAQATTDTFNLYNLTTGEHLAVADVAPAGAQGTSAECIAEAPTGPSGLELLTNFGSASFGGCEATVAGATTGKECQLISGSGCPHGSEVTLDHIQGTLLRYIPVHKASVASAGGSAFVVTWHHD